MDDTYNSPLGDANPYAPESARLRRRGVAAAAYGPATTDPYKGNWAAETTRSVLARSAADYRYAPEVIARYAFGDEEGARDVAHRWQGKLQEAQDLGPAVQDFSQAKDAGGFISALGYQAANMAPDVAAAVLTGGVTAGLAKRGARKAAVNLAADGLEATAERTAARTAAREAAGEAAKAAAMRESGSVPAAVSKRVRGAMAGVDDQFRKESMREALAIAGRTPSTIAGIEAAGTRGFRVGATVAGIPTLSETNVERYADEGTSSADAAKLLAGTAGASLLQSFPLERLAGRFGGEAAEQIAQKGERFLPRVTKEFGKQGVAEGSQEAAQQAIQLASHAWMDENWDPLTSEEGRSSILQNAMAGFLLGGVLGAGAETARSTSGAVGSAARASKAAYGKLRDAAREQLTKLAEKARSAEKRRRAGEPMDPDDAGAPAGAGGLDLQGFFAKAKDLAGKGLDATTTAATGLKDTIAGRFKDIASGHTQAEEIDAVADAFADEMLAMDGKGYPGQLRDPTQNRFQYKTGQQRMMMSFVDESKLDEPTAMKAAAILERLHTGKARGLDFADLQDMRDAGLIRNSTYAAIALAGNERSKYGAQVAEENAKESAGMAAVDAAAMGLDVQDTSRAVTNEDDGVVDETDWDAGIAPRGAERLPAVDRMLSARRSIPEISSRLRALSADNDPTGENKAFLENERQRAVDEGLAARTEAVNEILGGKSALWEENRSSERAQKDFADRTGGGKFAGSYVQLRDLADVGNVPGKVMRAQLLDLATLIQRQRVKINAEGTKNESIPAQQALLRGVGELKTLGVELNFDTLKPGPIYKISSYRDSQGQRRYKRDGIVGVLTESDVEALRTAQGGTIVRGDAEKATADGRVDTRAETIDEAGGDFAGQDAEQYKLVPRELPPGRMVDGGFVPDVVADVDVKDPYAGQVAEAKAARADKSKAPAQRREAVHAAGVAIGMRELQHEFDSGAISEKFFNREVARLNNYDSGASRRYLNRAASGGFVRAKVRELPADNAAQKGSDGDYELREIETKEGDTVEHRAADFTTLDALEKATDRNRKRWQQLTRREATLRGYTQTKKVKGELAEIAKHKQQILAAENPNTGTRTAQKNRSLAVQNEDVDPGAASASSETGPHNLKAEQSMLNAILKALGINERVTRLEDLEGADRNGLKGGQYVRARRLIRMNRHIHGAERVEILMHELGHHIIWNEIAKYTEGGWDALNAMSLAEAVDTLAKGNPKLYKALRKDFDAWYASGQRSTSPTHRHLKKVTNGLGRTYSDEATAFHEWFADHIARSLAGKRQTVGIVGEFFSAIATQLRKAWQLVTAMPELKPAPSVDAWVKQMLKAETAAVKAATGVSVTADTADAAVRAAAASAAGVDARDPLVVIGEAIDDMVVYVRSVLPKEERLILERMFSSHGALAQLRKFYNDHGRGDLLKRIDAAKSGMEARIAMGYIAWQQGAFNPGTEGRKALLTAQGDLLSIFGMAGDTDLAQRVLEDIASGKIERMRARDQAYSVRELEARARGTRQRALNWLAKEGPVSSALAKFWGSQYSRLHSAGIPALRHLIALVQRPQGATSDDQDRGLNPALRLKNAHLHTQLHAAIKDLDDAQRGHVLDLLQRGAVAGEVAYDKKPPAIRKAVDDLRAMTGEVFDYMVAAGAINKDKRHDNFWPVTLSLTDDTAKARLFKLYNQPEKFEKSIREFFGYWEDEGKPTKGGKRSKAVKNLPPVKQEVLDFFARRRNKATGKAADTNASIIEAFKTGDIRALERHIEKANTRLAANDYSQETVEFIELEIRYAKARIAELAGVTSAPVAEAPATEAGPGKPKTDRKRVPDTESKFEDLVQRLVDGAGEFDGEMRVGASETEVDPAFKGLNHRVSQFVYEHGDEKDRHAFAKLQSKDFDEIFARYFAPAVRNAEYTRRFGGGPKNRDKLDALLAEAKKQGATKEDLELAENAVKAAIGTYGMDGSPTLNAISPALAKKLSGPRTKAFIQGAQAYQNTRLLPLALLSSLVDPMGIAVRSGGDLKETWTGFKDGIRALAKGKEGKELLAMLEEIGAGDEFLPALAAHPVFDGNENAFAKKVNEFVFKWNGMSSWVMATRIMAMTAGHKFLLKHAAAYDTDDTSRRFLDELSLTPADVQADAEKPGRVVLNDKTREALRQFVDEAILRPNSTQVPLWHSDPYMGLVTQYKAFGYAIYDQISGRVVRELNHGNYRVMLAALAYLPLALMAELLRELIQYGDEGNPRREDWGVVDYTALAAERTGLLGPQAAIAGDVKGDIGRNELPGTSQLGPTLGQAENAADAFEGRRSLGGEFEGALPASAAWKHWNDGSSEGLQRRNAA